MSPLALEDAINAPQRPKSEQKTNEIMKVLTLMASIFIPLTFIAGIYGMNFDNMPELHAPRGYFGALAAMVMVAAAMIIYFRRRGWLGRPPRRR